MKDRSTHKQELKAFRAKQATGAEEQRKLENQARLPTQPDTGKPQHELELMEPHPLAELVPPMSEERYQEFLADIKKNGGLTDPIITTYEGKILDGRHRERACRELGIPRAFKRYEGTDPAGFVISKNIMRRDLNLTDDQRVALIAKIRLPQLEAQARERQRKGGQEKVRLNSTEAGKVTQQIAAEAKVSEHKGRQAVTAVKAGVAEDVIARKKSLREAANAAPTKKRKPSSKPKKEKSFEDQVFDNYDEYSAVARPEGRTIVFGGSRTFGGPPKSAPTSKDGSSETSMAK